MRKNYKREQQTKENIFKRLTFETKVKIDLFSPKLFIEQTIKD